MQKSVDSITCMQILMLMSKVNQEEEEAVGEVIHAIMALTEGAATLVTPTLLFILDRNKNEDGNSLNSSTASNSTKMRDHRTIATGTVVEATVEHSYQ